MLTYPIPVHQQANWPCAESFVLQNAPANRVAPPPEAPQNVLEGTTTENSTTTEPQTEARVRRTDA